jgi:hypothetical protein
MMINRLTGDRTGLTAWNVFLIDRAFLLTVFGYIISYFIVILRFKTNSQIQCIQ